MRSKLAVLRGPLHLRPAGPWAVALVFVLSNCVRLLDAQADSVISCGIAGRRTDAQNELLPSPLSTTGTKSLIFFRARFPDDKEDPVSVEEAESTLAEVSGLFDRISYGKFNLTWTVSPVLHLSKPREEYSGNGGFERFLSDVRAAGLEAGYDYLDFDLDVVRHSGVPGFQGGNANLGYRGAQVQAGGAVILVHELGHNLGLSHANTWTTGLPGISLGSPPLPSNYQHAPEPRSIPVYPDSHLGHESVIGPGFSAEYGDATDIMGSGTVEFSAVYRAQLGWLPEHEMITSSAGATLHRIQGTDSPPGEQTLPRAIRVDVPVHTPAGTREYWVQLPPMDTNRLVLPGVQLRWADPSAMHDDSLLLAPLAGTPGIHGGTLLPPGRTFSDPQAGLHITVAGVGGEGNGRWADVWIVHGNDHLNRAPSVIMTASSLTAGIDETVSLSAAANDPDGDSLVWRWEFGDGRESTSPGGVSTSWRRAGDFVVSVEVGDTRGGIGRGQVVVRVGAPRTYRIGGRVLTAQGEPVSGVRVHNGLAGPSDDGRRAARCFTDDSGRYTLTDLVPGTYTNGAFLFGFNIVRRSPVTIVDQNISDFDFVATPLPRVSVTAPSRVDESAGITNLFVFTRSEPADEALTVLYQLGGTAAGGRDYARPLLDRVVIPAGALTAALQLDIFDDGAGEPAESIDVTVVYPSSALRKDAEGNLFTVYYPGYELADIDGEAKWVLTEPAYLPDARSTASVTIVDNDLPAAQLVSAHSSDGVAIEEPRVEGSFTISRSGNVSGPLTVLLELSGSARNGVDYTHLDSTVSFASNETEKVLLVQPIADGVTESDEEVVLSVRPGAGYGIELGNATLTIRDTSVVPQTLAAERREDGTLQLTLTGQPGSRLILESSTNLIQWMPVKTNLLFNSNTAVVILPLKNDLQSVYRTVRQP